MFKPIFVKHCLHFVKYTLLIMGTNTSLSQKNILKNTKILALWTVFWLGTMALVSFGSKWIWNFNTTISIIFILINLIAGAGMILANIRHLRSLDELQRKLNLDAMAISLGVGVVGGLSYSMMDVVNLIPNNAEISFLVILISLTYLIGVIIGNLRYR